MCGRSAVCVGSLLSPIRDSLAAAIYPRLAAWALFLVRFAAFWDPTLLLASKVAIQSRPSSPACAGLARTSKSRSEAAGELSAATRMLFAEAAGALFGQDCADDQLVSGFVIDWDFGASQRGAD